MQVYGKISPIQAQIHSQIVIWSMENPVKPSFSVHVENTLNYRSVCQHKADLHLSQCLPMALQPRLFLPLTITHMNPLNPARTPM
jgi:hypothetical protein